ncbi:hypothetical protein J1N35_011923, partial [Gossypium stocksii]
KVLSSPEYPTQEEGKEDADDLQEEAPQNDDAKPKPKKVTELVVERNREPVPTKEPFLHG